MSVHIGAKPGEIAETVLMPGDPYRAKWAAETFLKDATCINQVRGMLGFTGTFDGRPLPAEPGRDRGVVFQRYSVFPHLTVLGNVLLGLELDRARITAHIFGRPRRVADVLPVAVAACELLVNATALGWQAGDDLPQVAGDGGVEQQGVRRDALDPGARRAILEAADALREAEEGDEGELTDEALLARTACGAGMPRPKRG